MPELPEVETVRRGLEEVLLGETLAHVLLRRKDLRFPFPENFCARLIGQRITAMGRRAKYLVAHLSGGEVLIMHLGMSGRIRILKAGDWEDCEAGTSGSQSGRPPRENAGAALGAATHDHVLFRTGSGTLIVYNDPRRFGFMDLTEATKLEDHRLLRNLGPEPLGNQLDPDYLAGIARGRKTDLKAFLMDQRNIAGLGNIYVCEALFRAGLSPDRKAATLSSKSGKPLQRTEVLLSAIRSVLHDAIAAGGSSLRDYKQTDGSLGYFQHGFEVYGREGETCARAGCNGLVAKKVHAGRSTFHCRACQT